MLLNARLQHAGAACRCQQAASTACFQACVLLLTAAVQSILIATEAVFGWGRGVCQSTTALQSCQHSSGSNSSRLDSTIISIGARSLKQGAHDVLGHVR